MWPRAPGSGRSLDGERCSTWTTTATVTWICSSPTTSVLLRARTSARREQQLQLERAPGRLRAARAAVGTVFLLLRNNGDGTFTDVSQVVFRYSSYGMTVAAPTWMKMGGRTSTWPAAQMPSLNCLNNRDGTFRRGVARRRLAGDDGEQAGMGVAIGSYDLDGHLDQMKTHFADDASGLSHNDGTEISTT